VLHGLQDPVLASEAANALQSICSKCRIEITLVSCVRLCCSMCCTDCRTRYWPARPPMLFRASAPSAEHRWRIISQVPMKYVLYPIYRTLCSHSQASSDVFCLMLNFYAHFLTRQNLYLFCIGQDSVFSVSLMIFSRTCKNPVLFSTFFSFTCSVITVFFQYDQNYYP